jgi:hypothetical protein
MDAREGVKPRAFRPRSRGAKAARVVSDKMARYTFLTMRAPLSKEIHQVEFRTILIISTTTMFRFSASPGRTQAL